MCWLLVANLFGIATKKSSRSFTYIFKLTCVDNIQNAQFWFISKGKNTIENKDTNEHFRVKSFVPKLNLDALYIGHFLTFVFKKAANIKYWSCCQFRCSTPCLCFSKTLTLNSRCQGQQSCILWNISYDCYSNSMKIILSAVLQPNRAMRTIMRCN